MKVLAIGDPHGNLEKIKTIPLNGIDLIILTGDLGKADLMRKRYFEKIKRKEQGLPEKEYSNKEKKEAFMEAYNSTIELVKYLSKSAPVLVIFGNVESSNVDTKKESKKIGLPLPFLTDDLKKLDNVKVINNKFVKFRGLRIGGLQYFIDFNWIEDFKPKDLKKKLAQAKKDNPKAEKTLKKFYNLDILVCHQPPYGFLDVVNFPAAPVDWQGKHSGSKIILDYINRNQPKYVFCGHIHEGEGSAKIGKTEVFNLGVCGYKVINFD